MVQPSHVHHFTPGIDTAKAPLVLLHGSGGDEHDLLPLAAEIAPGTGHLAIRGAVSMDGGFAFFHRFPDRSIDEADIAARTPILAEFIAAEADRHRFSGAPVAVGFSNGAIMAAALLLTHPNLFAAAILFRPLSPFNREPTNELNGMPVLILDGEKDSRRSPGDGLLLAERLTCAGAMVTHRVLPVGHSITALDRQIARAWLERMA